MWTIVLAENMYPMTALWPVSTVRRIIHFVMSTKRFFSDVIDCYDEEDGDYYGDEGEEEEEQEGTDEDEDDGNEMDENQLVLSQVDDVF